jgi:hypothetical protein
MLVVEVEELIQVLVEELEALEEQLQVDPLVQVEMEQLTQAVVLRVILELADQV